MAAEIIDSTDATFEKDVLQSDLPVIVDYCAPWCGPYRQIAPVLEELAAENAGKVRVVKVNVDNNRGVAMKYQIQGIPTLLGVKGGEVVSRSVGFSGKPGLQKLFDAVL